MLRRLKSQNLEVKKMSSSVIKKAITSLRHDLFKVVVRACYEAYFVAQYLAPNLVSGRPA